MEKPINTYQMYDCWDFYDTFITRLIVKPIKYQIDLNIKISLKGTFVQLEYPNNKKES